MNVQIIVDLHAKEGKGERLAAYFREEVYPLAKQSPGFQAIRLLRDQEDADHLMEVESWDSAEKYRTAVERMFAEKGPGLMELLAQAPSIHVLDQVEEA